MGRGGSLEAEDYRNARAELEKVKPFLPQMERKAADLAPTAKTLFSGWDIEPDLRRDQPVQQVVTKP
ncbi:MAG: hypothetical protein HY319_03590 [Armatimonadetes bacterium]|nr:hypothetical protein [Armatimonadota bacterium]